MASPSGTANSEEMFKAESLPTAQMASSSNTSNIDKITALGTDNKNKGKAIALEEDTVRVLVAYNGKWEWAGKEWLFKDFKGSIMDMPKNGTLSQITDILYAEFKVEKWYYDLKLEVHYRVGSPWFPIIKIEREEDLKEFISESWEKKLPLCVTLKRKKGIEEVSPHQYPKGLIKAIQEGKWEEAKKCVTKEVTWTSKLNDAGNTALHFFVGRYKNNDAVEEIVECFYREPDDLFKGTYKDKAVLFKILSDVKVAQDHQVANLLLNTVTIDGLNPAHTAAQFGNKEALEELVGLTRKCLFIPDYNQLFAIDYALMIPAIETFKYLFDKMKWVDPEKTERSKEYDEFLSDREFENGTKLLSQVIDTGLIDVASELINDCSNLAKKDDKTALEPIYKTALERIIRKPELFYSGTSYSFYSRFVYHIVPTKNNNLGSNDKTRVEGQELNLMASTSGNGGPIKGQGRVPAPPKFAGPSVTIIGFTGNLVEVTNKSSIRPPQNKFGPPKKNALVPPLTSGTANSNKTNEESMLTTQMASSSTTSEITADVVPSLGSNDTTDVESLQTRNKDKFVTKHTRKCLHTIFSRISDKLWETILHVFSRISDKLWETILHDGDGNNILHLAGRLAPTHKLNAASGAALQMQRELQWFEEVKRLVGITHTRALNKYKETPMMVFRRAHKELRKDGEAWMKKTADSYTITAALIITIVFAAAITVPGGNDEKTGKPIYETKSSLIIFAISDAISLFTATTSLLLFLSILTARYADEDFLYKLPKRLICGLVMLFVSVTSMLIAFSAALYIMLGHEKEWILIPIAALACLPIASFVTLQFPLLVELISSTYGHGYFGKEKDDRSADANKKKRA